MAVHKGQLASITTRRGIRRPELLAIGAAQPGALFELFSGAPARRTVMVRADSAVRSPIGSNVDPTSRFA